VSGEIAIDFGSSMTRVADVDGTLLFEEPTIAAIDSDSGRLLAFGSEALGLGARSAGRVRIAHPVRNGKIAEVDLAERVISDALSRCGIGRLERPRAVACTHIEQTAVQDRAIERALRKAGIRSVRSIEHPIAAAIGADLPIADAVGRMVVDVGGGTTDVAVIALGGIVCSVGVEVGVDDLDATVRTYFYRELDLVIDLATSAALREAATAGVGENAEPIDSVEGRDARSGEPRRVEIDLIELQERVERVIRVICDGAIEAISGAPPDVANDLVSSGLLLVGGGAFLSGLNRKLARATGVPVHVPAEPARTAVRGAARSVPAASSGLDVTPRFGD
jgi:rod shape-determining protein MreB